MPAHRHLNTSHCNLKSISKNAAAKAKQGITTFEHNKFAFHKPVVLFRRATAFVSFFRIIHIIAMSLLRNKGNISSYLNLKGFHSEYLRVLWDVTGFYIALSDFYCTKTKITGFTWDIICTASRNSATVVNYDKIFLLLSS